MRSRADQFLDVYRKARLQDQLGYYDNRRKKYERAHGELLVASAILLGITSTASALAGTQIHGRLAWAVAAAILPTLSTALAAYGGLFAFERNAKLYRDALRNLTMIDEPNLSRIVDEREAATALAMYVEQVENVFRSEQAQWGQLTAEHKQAEDKSD